MAGLKFGSKERQKIKEAKLEIDRISKENEARTKANTRIEIIQAQTDGFLDNLKQVLL